MKPSRRPVCLRSRTCYAQTCQVRDQWESIVLVSRAWQDFGREEVQYHYPGSGPRHNRPSHSKFILVVQTEGGAKMSPQPPPRERDAICYPALQPSLIYSSHVPTRASFSQLSIADKCRVGSRPGGKTIMIQDREEFGPPRLC